jgi:hypothetical protein
MIAHKMTAAFPAELSLTDFGLFEHGNVFRTCSDPHGVWLPKGESIDRATRPRSA